MALCESFESNLQTRCLNNILNDIDNHIDQLQYLPNHLKDIIIKRADFDAKLQTVLQQGNFKLILHNQVSSLGLQDFILDSKLANALLICINLRNLRLSKVSVSHKILIDLLKNFPKLQKFECRNKDCINDEIVVTLAETAPYLREVVIGNCEITNLAVEAFIKFSKYLIAIEVSISHVDSIVLRAFIDKFGAQLRDLRLTQAQSLMDEDIEYIREKCPVLEMFTSDGPHQIDNRFSKAIKQTTWTIPF